jgi:hypothetical protein
MPYAQTIAVLGNGAFLIIIAFDRYMAIKRINKGAWQPTKAFCLVCCLFVWGFAAAVSSPLLGIYNHPKVHVVINEQDPGFDFYDGYTCERNEVKFEKIFELQFFRYFNGFYLNKPIV